MKIIEALKAQKRTDDKINHNCELIQNYAAKLSTEKPLFETDEDQRIEVKKLEHANESLKSYYLWLKRSIDYTNVMTEVEINGKVYTITDLLNLKRLGCDMMERTYNSLNDDKAIRRLSRSQMDNVTIDRFYDERQKNTKLAEWRNLKDAITSKLEIVNATTDLLEITPEPSLEEYDPNSENSNVQEV